MDASNDFILRNRWNAWVCIQSMTLLGGKKAGRLLKVPLFYFHSIGVSFVHLRTGDCSPDQRLLWQIQTHTHTQNECLFNGLGASRVMISPESGPPRAKATLTAAEPQVGQRSTTELGRNSCPSNPLGSAVSPLNGWLRCVRRTTGPFNTSAVAPTSDSLPPAALPLTTSLSPDWSSLSLSASLQTLLPSGALYSHVPLGSEARWSNIQTTSRHCIKRNLTLLHFSFSVFILKKSTFKHPWHATSCGCESNRCPLKVVECWY